MSNMNCKLEPDSGMILRPSSVFFIPGGFCNFVDKKIAHVEEHKNRLTVYILVPERTAPSDSIDNSQNLPTLGMRHVIEICNTGPVGFLIADSAESTLDAGCEV